MALNLVKSDCKTLNTQEILATLATCKCGEIYEQYRLCTDGKIRKRGVCPDCQREILNKARKQRLPGAPRLTAAKRAKIAVEREKLEAENMTLKERLEKAKAEAEAAAEQGGRVAEYSPPAKTVKAAEPAAPAPVIEEPSAPIRLERPVAPAAQRNVEGVITLDLRPYPSLIEEIKLLALEDVRTIEQEAIWILMDYAKFVRSVARETLDRAKEDRSKPKDVRDCKYRDW